MGTVPALEQIKKRMQSSVPMKWLFTGDSITHGALHTWGYRDYTEHFSERLRYEIGRPRDIVIKTGISGWTGQAIRNALIRTLLDENPDWGRSRLSVELCNRWSWHNAKGHRKDDGRANPATQIGACGSYPTTAAPWRSVGTKQKSQPRYTARADRRRTDSRCPA